MKHFNLVDEPWIPVRLLDGGRTELGIRETLRRTREVAALEDPSPLVIAGLYRFLLALLYRSLSGPRSFEEARALFGEGLPGAKIDAYLDQWREHFWLFHDQWPFGQIPDFEPKEWRTWTALAAEANADNAKVLFDHVNVQDPGEIPPSAAARWLLAAQTFSVSCGNSELSHTKKAPSATGAMALPMGRDLHDTLAFNLVPQNGEVFTFDLPIWERQPDSLVSLRSNPTRPIHGLADLYTWRTRAIRLHPEASGNVTRVAFASGMDFQEGLPGDPMFGYRVDEKLGRLPIQIRNLGIWRDFDSFLPGPKDAGNAPQVVQHAIHLARGNPGRLPRVALILGQVIRMPKANIEFWRMERFSLPGTLARDEDLRSEIRIHLDRAEKTQISLRSACRRFARALITRGDRDPGLKDIRDFQEQMIPIPLYWSCLEARFHELLDAYALEKSEAETRSFWLASIREALHLAWNQHQRSVLRADAWAIRALVNAEPPVMRELSLLDQEIANLTTNPLKEGA